MLATGDQTANGQPILVTQDDVRNIQLAKAALYAGAKLLMNRMGVERVERITLAGAFGSYIDPQYAMLLGLIPCLLYTSVMPRPTHATGPMPTSNRSGNFVADMGTGRLHRTAHAKAQRKKRTQRRISFLSLRPLPLCAFA